MLNPLDDRAVYTLDDLRRWEELRPGLPPSLAVLGHPVAHSVSPQMHNAALAELAKTYPELAAWRYFKFDIEPEKLEEAIKLLMKKEFQGVNLTVPHKVAALKFIHDVNADVHSIGAMNTLVRPIRPIWSGIVTDLYGLQEALFRDLNISLTGRFVVVLGAGGAARSAAVLCLQDNCAALRIGNRNKHNLDALLQEIQPLDSKNRIQGFDLARPPAKEWPEDVIVINATSVGVKPDESPPLAVALLGSAATVFDMIYHPTKLVSTAKARGLRAADGLSMLVWQGASSLCIWASPPGRSIRSDSIAQTMMDAACDALGLNRRKV